MYLSWVIPYMSLVGGMLFGVSGLFIIIIRPYTVYAYKGEDGADVTSWCKAVRQARVGCCVSNRLLYCIALVMFIFH